MSPPSTITPPRPRFDDQSIRRPVPLPASWKANLRQWGPTGALWTRFRAAQVRHEYERRREHYAQLAAERKLVYSEPATRAAVRERIAARGYSPTRRRPGDIHTFACIPLYSWHEHLLPDLRELGPVTHFDYTALGYGVEELARADRQSRPRRREMLDRLLAAFRAAHERRPVDWIFWYGGGQDVAPDVVRRIANDFGIPTANMSLDDKQGWAGPYADDGCRTGAVDITAEFDVYMTSSRVACEWHLVEGGRPIYLPEGFSDVAFHPDGSPRDISVSFIGAAYGFRTAAIRYLRQHGVAVETFGSGWTAGPVWGAQQVSVINRSLINLGMGGIEYSESLTNVKTRDFEIPGTGGGMYLTSFNPDLALHFNIGDEIACYRNRDEMLELCRYYLQRPDEAEAMAKRARARCLREHRWLHRYLHLLGVLGITDATAV